MNILKMFFKRMIWKFRKLLGINSVMLLLGKLLIERNRLMQKTVSLSEAEFKVFSQWGEDGIIQFLIQRLEIPHKVFVEFGVGDYTEANTRFLLINNNWSGLVIDSAKENVDFIKHDDIYWRYDLRAECSFITRDNINQLMLQNIKDKDIGLLVIDIDGNDYWIWKAIDVVNPRIIICEYNGIFGYEHSITVPYDEKFNRAKKHYSNLYWGSSLSALNLLAEEKGYVFIGCNSNGNNAFFIRKDISPFKSIELKNGFIMPKFRESRNPKQRLTYVSGKDRIKAIFDMEVFDIEWNKNVLVKEILG